MKFKYVSACVGTGAIWDKDAKDYQTLKQVMSAFPDIPCITIDVANAYHESFVDFVTKIRSEYPEKVIIAGNVVTPNMTEELIIKGADIVKVEIVSTGDKFKTNLSVIKSVIKSNEIRSDLLQKRVNLILKNKVKNKKIWWLFDHLPELFFA